MPTFQRVGGITEQPQSGAGRPKASSRRGMNRHGGEQTAHGIKVVGNLSTITSIDIASSRNATEYELET